MHQLGDRRYCKQLHAFHSNYITRKSIPFTHRIQDEVGIREGWQKYPCRRTQTRATVPIRQIML